MSSGRNSFSKSVTSSAVFIVSAVSPLPIELVELLRSPESAQTSRTIKKKKNGKYDILLTVEFLAKIDEKKLMLFWQKLLFSLRERYTPESWTKNHVLRGTKFTILCVVTVERRFFFFWYFLEEKTYSLTESNNFALLTK